MTLRLSFTPHAWEDYLDWQRTDKAVLKRLNLLLQEVLRTPFEGIGKPESLRENLSGYWSRRITGEHRLVYCLKDDTVIVHQCRGHYTAH
jgi:toxin YoeB